MPAAPRQGPGKQGAGPERGGDRDLRLSGSDTLQLHQSLVDSLSLVGLLSIEVVEKHFLDLYLMLRALGPAFDWDGFLAPRRRERVEKACVNVLAVFLELWDCAGELPGLAAALRARHRLIELDGAGEAVALIERPRGNRENRTWYRRVYPRSLPRFWAWRLTRDLPHTLARAGRRRP